MSGLHYPRGCDSARLLLVIETKAARGSGNDPDDPVRTVTEYWSLEGRKLAEVDPIVQTADEQLGTLFPQV